MTRALEITGSNRDILGTFKYCMGMDEKCSKLKIELEQNEVVMLSNALNCVCNGPYSIEDWEFETLMGAKRIEVKAILEKLNKLYEIFPRMSQT